MILKLENLTVERFGRLSMFLASDGNQLIPPPPYKQWAYTVPGGSVVPNWVTTMPFVRLVHATQKADTFSVTLDVTTSAAARKLPVPASGDEECTDVTITAEPLLKLFGALSFYPAEYAADSTAASASSDKPSSIIEVIECYRAGSCDYAVRAPNGDWMEKVARAAARNYGRICIVVRTENITGYDGYPGCQLWFYPGDEKGQLEGEMLWPYRPESLAKSQGQGGAFGISTSIDEITALRDACDNAIANMKARQKKSSNSI